MKPNDTAQVLHDEWQAFFRRAAFEAPTHAKPQEYFQRDLCQTLARWIPDDASVLDAECGVGDLLASLPQKNRVGLTSVDEVALEAQRRHPEIRFVCGQLEDLPGNERFDAVVADRLCHSVIDIRQLLVALRARLTEQGRIFLIVYNYLWEVPARVAEKTGIKLPAPMGNWLSHSDFQNLFAITGLDLIRFEDRLLLPMDIPGVSTLLNRYIGKLPGCQNVSLYRIYALRKQELVTTPTPVRVSVVIPSRNERGNVEAAIQRMPVMGSETELIFVEGGSTDGTWDAIQSAIAKYQGPLKLRALQQTGKGKGDAVRLGFSQASGDILMILDADLTVEPEELPVFYDVMVRKLGDYVQGTRLVYPMERQAMRFFNKLGNIAFSRLFTYLLQQPIKDTLCGTKVLWRRDYERLARARHVFGDFDPFGDFDLIFGAARLNLKIVEIPIRYRERTYGETNISRWKHGWLLLKMSAVAARKLRYV